MDKSLQHHGVLGMKWGVRRYQPYPKGHHGGREVGEAAKAAKISKHDAKKWYKKNRKEVISKHTDYLNEYDKTPEGRKKLAAYEKALKEMERSDSWSDDDDRRFLKIEADYQRASEKYAAEKLLEEYGGDLMSVYVNNGRVKTGEDVVREVVRKFGGSHL